MTNEQKETLLGKLAREQYGKLLHIRIFKEGAKAILDNPSEFGLMPILDSMDHIEESDQNWSEVVDNLKSQLAKYRKAFIRQKTDKELAGTSRGRYYPLWYDT